MTENICLMLTESESIATFVRGLSLAVAAVDLHKRTVLYVDGPWTDIATREALERRESLVKMVYKDLSVLSLFRHFLNAGGQVWISPLGAQALQRSKQPLVAGVRVVDEQTLLTFLTQGTVVLNF